MNRVRCPEPNEGKEVDPLLGGKVLQPRAHHLLRYVELWGEKMEPVKSCTLLVDCADDGFVGHPAYSRPARIAHTHSESSQMP